MGNSNIKSYFATLCPPMMSRNRNDRNEFDESVQCITFTEEHSSLTSNEIHKRTDLFANVSEDFAVESLTAARR